MLLNLFLGAVYYFGGMFLTLVAAMCLGFLLCAFIALTNLVAYRWTWALLLGYLAAAGLCYGVILLGLYGAGCLGDHTGYKMQTMMIAGAVFPGIFSLAVIPAYARMGARQSRGNFDTDGI
jgi:hypothetical protein